ncbi:MAG: hypothetical protein AVDCRST_MAG08-3132, partial [uncultured Acetobacteraceae bacterium]
CCPALLCQWHRRARCWCRLRQVDQHMTAVEFGGRFHTRRQSRRRTSGTVRGSSSTAKSCSSSPPEGGLAQRREVGVRQHGER